MLMTRNRKRTFIILGSIALVFLVAWIILYIVGETDLLGLIIGELTVLLILTTLFISYKGEKQV
jgi:hypothetical protein